MSICLQHSVDTTDKCVDVDRWPLLSSSITLTWQSAKSQPHFCTCWTSYLHQVATTCGCSCVLHFALLWIGKQHASLALSTCSVGLPFSNWCCAGTALPTPVKDTHCLVVWPHTNIWQSNSLLVICFTGIKQQNLLSALPSQFAREVQMIPTDSFIIPVPADPSLCHIPLCLCLVFSYHAVCGNCFLSTKPYDHNPNAKSDQYYKCVTQPQVEVLKNTEFNISSCLREASKILAVILKNLLLCDNFTT
jgi:hypothetical protein